MRRAVRRAILAALLIGGAAGAATWTVFFSSLLGVREVTVTGTMDLSSDRVREAARVTPGAPMVTLDLPEIRRRVAAILQVESARVDRSWPGTVRVTVVERVPVAAVPLGPDPSAADPSAAAPSAAAAAGADGAGAGGAVLEARARRMTAVVDRFGVILDRVVVASPRLPVLRVQRPGPGDPPTRAALAVLTALPEDLAQDVRELRAPSARAISLRLTDGRLIVWGDASRTLDKVRLLQSLLLTRVDGARPTSFDVSSPDVVTVK